MQNANAWPFAVIVCLHSAPVDNNTQAANGHDQCYHGHMGIGHKPCSHPQQHHLNNTTWHPERSLVVHSFWKAWEIAHMPLQCGIV